MDECPVCGSRIDHGAGACGICGTVFDSMPPRCPLCETEIDEAATECPNCGAEIAGGQEQPPSTEMEEVEIAEMPSEKDRESAELIAKDVFVDVELEELVKLSGVGPLKAKILYDAGFTDLRKLKQASVVELMNIRGIGRKAAGEIKAALRESSLEEIRETKLTRENVDAEYQCPLCETIVSAYESSCYECGCIFEPSGVPDEDSDRLALSYYDSKLLRSPDNKELWYARGATLVKMDEFDHALNSFDRALELDSSFQAAWMSKAEVYNKLGDSTKAAECYSHIISSASADMAPARDDDLETAGPAVEDEMPDAPDEEPGPVEETGLLAEETPGEDMAEPEPIPDEYPENVQAPAMEPAPSVEAPTGEDMAEPEPVPEEIPAAELDVQAEDVQAEPEVMETGIAEGPEIVKPLSIDELPSDEMVLDMDYIRPPPERPDLGGMTDAELKKYLSKRASHVKPYLSLAKGLGVDINHAKRLIAKAVSESKKGELRMAIEIINEGIEYADDAFHKKLADDMESMVDRIRDLKMTGIDVSSLVDILTESRDSMEEGKIMEAVENLSLCRQRMEALTS